MFGSIFDVKIHLVWLGRELSPPFLWLSIQDYSSWDQWLPPEPHSTLLQHCGKHPQPEYVPFLAAGEEAV